MFMFNKNLEIDRVPRFTPSLSKEKHNRTQYVDVVVVVLHHNINIRDAPSFSYIAVKKWANTGHCRCDVW